MADIIEQRISLLTEAFRRCISVTEGSVKVVENPLRAFETSWWNRGSQEWTFVFREGLTVTNLQYAELFSLLSKHVEFDSDSKVPNLLRFESRERMSEFIRGLCNDYFLQPTREPTEAAMLETSRKVAKRFHNQLSTVGLIDPFLGSCNVALPKGAILDAEAVCGYSGYVHSCGRSIYRRTISKSDQTELFADLETHFAGRTGLLRNSLSIPQKISIRRARNCRPTPDSGRKMDDGRNSAR